jgi:hypothetical protein
MIQNFSSTNFFGTRLASSSSIPQTAVEIGAEQGKQQQYYSFGF